MLDLAALEAAGIARAAERAPLLEYLDHLGFTVDEMVQAEREGRLFGLAGDAVLRSGEPRYSLAAAAKRIGVRVEEVQHAWAALGLTAAGPDSVLLSQADLDALQLWAELRALMGAEASLGLLRVMGAGLARLAEAASAAIRVGVPEVTLGAAPDELTTAQSFRAVAGYVPRIGASMDAVFRHHLTAARMYFEGVVQDDTASVVAGVGFADLSGFTALTQRLRPDELSMLLTDFGGTVADVVHADGGRVVKFIGDAVMWVSPSADRLAQAAADLVLHPKAVEAGLQVRAGLAHGPMLAVAGDYFGTPVNLAARLVAAAEPAQILASPDVAERLTGWRAEALEPMVLRGFDVPQPVYALGR
ncbi:MAG: adenylate/guanylate cyclase domain-containing protein [Jatrophihabitans sp.]|uniref:adenylate/guanylate cyclase domain-containing protein n=1 Tax=Jatrophihabitans sp. TaxID=1932789 RepID=UPI003F7F047E